MATILEAVRNRLDLKRREPGVAYGRMAGDLASGKQFDADQIIGTLDAAGKTPNDLECDVAAIAKRKAMQATRLSGIAAVSQIKELTLLIDTTDAEESKRRAEVDADQAARRGQLSALQAAKAEGDKVEAELFSTGQAELRADYRDIKANEQRLGTLVGEADMALKVAKADAHQAWVKVHNVDVGFSEGDINQLRAAQRVADGKVGEAQRKLDAANAKFNEARELTAAARLAVIES